MSTIWQDLRFGVRGLAKRPGFTLVALATLALGIGANTAIFSVLNGVLLRPLGYRDAGRLVAVWESNGPKGIERHPVAYPNFLDWRRRSTAFDRLAVFWEARDTLTTKRGAERIPVARVSSDFLPMLGVTMAAGRPFHAEEDEPERSAVVILSHGFWQRRFGGSASAVGQTLTLRGEPCEIVGVLPAGFEFPLELSGAELWAPVGRDRGRLDQRGLHGGIGIGRLRPGVDLARARAEMDGIAAQLAREHPEYNEGQGVNLVPLHEQIVGGSRRTLFVLLGVVGIVLLIACSNVANLLLVRGRSRRREMAVRTALGARRRHLVQQFLLESLLLGLGGGTLGLLLAAWGSSLLQAALPLLEIPRLAEISLDWRVLLYTLAVSLLTGVGFGLAPALQSSRFQVSASLKEGGAGAAGSGRRLQGALVIAEVSLALMLFVGAGLLLRSLTHLMSVDPGFRTENALTFRLLAPSRRYAEADRLADLWHEAQERLRALPGVTAVGASTTVPLTGGSWQTSFQIASRTYAEDDDGSPFRYYSATPDYFQAMGIPLLRGRSFTEEDRRGRPGVAVINETMAAQQWPQGDPLGERLRLGLQFGEPDEPAEFEIVGIVGDVKHADLDADTMAQIYVPYRQHTNSTMHFTVRTEGDPRALAAPVRAALAALDPEIPLYMVSTLEEARRRSAASRRSALMLVGTFAALAVVLAAIGLYGVLSHTVSQRTRELGIRISLGAGGGDILRIVVAHGMVLAGTGVVVGVAGAALLTRVLESFLFGVTATDPATFAAVSLFLLAVAVAACCGPARRATRVDPMVALRCE